MKTSTVFLGVGSNLGDRRGNLQTAQNAIADFVTIHRTSQIYETPPWGILDQPVFLNQVWEGSTTLTPPQLLNRVKQMEIDLGRMPSIHYGPRLIDVDILLFSQLIFKGPGLNIPHPQIEYRAFVLAPLADLVPDLIIPGMPGSVREMLEKHDTSEIKVIEAEK